MKFRIKNNWLQVTTAKFNIQYLKKSYLKKPY